MTKRFKPAIFALLCALVFAVVMRQSAPETDTRDGPIWPELRGWKSLAKTPLPHSTPQPPGETKIRPTRKNMANKIARGATGQATFKQLSRYVVGDAYMEGEGIDSWKIYRNSGGSFAQKIVFPSETYLEPAGTNWNLSPSGQVTTENTTATAPDGVYTGSYVTVVRAATQAEKNEFGFVDNPAYYFERADYELEIVCMSATITLTYDAATQTTTATATTQGGTAPFTYVWTLPPDATNVTGMGNARSFKTNAGGNVSVLVTDADTPNPCTATATQHVCGLAASINLQVNTFDEPNFRRLGSTVTPMRGVAPYTVAWAPPSNAFDVVPVPAGNLTAPTVGLDFVVPGQPNPFDVTISATVTDSANPPCSRTVSATTTVEPVDSTGCPSGTHDDGAGQCVPDTGDPTEPCATGYVWNGTACVPDEPIDPPTPTCTLDCSFEIEDKGDNLYRITAVPTGATGAVAGTNWKREGAPLSSVALFIEQTIVLDASALFECTLTDSVCSITRKTRVSNDDDATTDPTNPPTMGAPGAPIVARDCESGALIVTAPAFPLGAVSLETQRDDGEAILHLFAAPGDWSDAETLEATAYRYRCRSVAADNARSEWGAWSAAKSRVSETLTVTWLLPDADVDEVSGRAVLRVQLTDSGETLDPCGNPKLPDGACPSLDVADAVLAFKMDGLALTAAQIAVNRVSGTPRNGVYEVEFDSRLFLSGTRTLEVTARGSDCCRARASRIVEVSNSFDQGVRWFEVSAPISETNAYISLQNEALYAHPLRRYFVQSVVCDQSATRAAWLDDNVADDNKNQAFDDLLERRAVALSRAVGGVTPAQTQWRGKSALKAGATALFWVQRWTPMQHLNIFNSLETDVVSLSPTGDGEEVAVFSRSGAATGETARARLAVYDDDTLTQKFDLTARGLGSARAIAWMAEHRAVYIVAGSGNSAGFYVLDLDAGQARYHVTLDDETRYPRWVARTGLGADAKCWLVLVNGALGEKRTAIYNYAPGAIELRAELDEAATFAGEAGGKFYVACAGDLFCIEESGATLKAEFAAPISALCARMEGENSSLIIGFENGLVRDEESEILIALNGEVGALASWAARDGEPDRAVAGGDGAKLTEELEGGIWSDARDLPLPASEPVALGIDRVTALWAVSRVVRPASGEPGQPGFVAAKVERELLIGTATDVAGEVAPLLVLRMAPPERIKGALLSSKFSRPAFEARAV